MRPDPATMPFLRSRIEKQSSYHAPCDPAGLPSRDAVQSKRQWLSLLCLGILFGLPGPGHAQRVTGRVVEDDTGERVAFVHVALIDSAGVTIRSTLSDSAGFFVLPAGRAGTYRLRALRLGFADYMSVPVEVGRDETVTVEIRLPAQGIPLPPLEVKARGREERGRDGFERRRALGKGVFLTVDSIRLREPRILSDAFYGIPGVQVFEGLGAVQIISAYGSKCFVMFRDHWPSGKPVGTLPDLRKPLPVPRSEGPINTLNVDWVQGIEIYRDISELPDELWTAWRIADIWPSGGVMSGGRKRYEPCGLIWIWTGIGW